MKDKLYSESEIMTKLLYTKPYFGEDSTKERYRYMQWLADTNAIKELKPARAIKIELIDKTLKDFLESEGGESWLRIDGKEYNTDVGYALEGMEIFVEVLKKRLTENDKRGNEE